MRDNVSWNVIITQLPLSLSLAPHLYYTLSIFFHDKVKETGRGKGDNRERERECERENGARQ